MEITTDFYAKGYYPGSNGWIIPARTESPWFWALIVYDTAIIVVCMALSYRLKKATKSQRKRKQAGILFISSAASLVTGLTIMTFVSILEFDIPDITPIAGAIWSVGIFYSIVKYKLMAMTPAFIAESLF